jgi:hypothetical protein
MPNQSPHIRTLVHALVGVLLVLGICAAPMAMADGEGPFTIASLQGRYAYVNNNGGVASFGPMSFDGQGGLTLKDKVNLPCSDPAPSCARVIVDLTGDGTYTVNPDGTGAATITFTLSDGTVFSTDTFDFIISGTTKQGATRLATQVFAADQAGGLAGQLVAPTWTRIAD